MKTQVGEVGGNAVVCRQGNMVGVSEIDEIEEETLYFGLVSGGKVFLHRGGGGGVEGVNNGEVVVDGIGGCGYPAGLGDGG